MKQFTIFVLTTLLTLTGGYAQKSAAEDRKVEIFTHE